MVLKQIGGADYFWKEYRLNYAIATYDKPQVMPFFQS